MLLELAAAPTHNLNLKLKNLLCYKLDFLSYQPNEDFLLSDAQMLTCFAPAHCKYIISIRHLLIPTAHHAVLPWLISYMYSNVQEAFSVT